MKVGIAFLTKDRCELSQQSILPLCGGPRQLYWIDGSVTEEGENLPNQYAVSKVWRNVRGGADAAIVFALTKLLEDGFDFLGLCENDVLLHQDWFARTMSLFERGAEDGLTVGAVSPRCYEDRILFQRDGYAVCHNLGAGIVIFTREAAKTVLAHYRTGWSTENRAVFAQLADVDIGRYWAFRASEHMLTADWQFDRILASHGLASLALTPSCVEMIGQSPPLEEQGLTLVDKPVELLRDDNRFWHFAKRMRSIRSGEFEISRPIMFRDPGGSYTYFPHQLGMLGGEFAGEWRLKWAQGFGPFGWRAEENASLRVPVFGSCELLVSGGENGAAVEAIDQTSGYAVNPNLLPENGGRLMQLVVPGGYSRRDVILNVEPGGVFYGVRTPWEQPMLKTARFDHSFLPPV